MRDYAELVKAMRYCSEHDNCGSRCPRFERNEDCVEQLTKDAADAIEELLRKMGAKNSAIEFGLKRIENLQAENEQLKDQVPTWISVEERLPETRSSILGQKSNKVIVAFRFDDGTQGTDTAHTLNGDWVFEDRIVVVNRTVTHWMPLPAPPLEEYELEGGIFDPYFVEGFE